LSKNKRLNFLKRVCKAVFFFKYQFPDPLGLYNWFHQKEELRSVLNIQFYLSHPLTTLFYSSFVDSSQLFSLELTYFKFGSYQDLILVKKFLKFDLEKPRPGFVLKTSPSLGFSQVKF